MRRLSLPLACLFLTLCSTPPPANMENIARICSQFSHSEKLIVSKGFGALDFFAKGQRVSAKFGLQRTENSNVTFDIYSFLGGTIASLSVDSTGVWTLKDDNGIYLKNPDDSAFSGTDFFNYPFSNSEFSRIITGRLPDGIISARPPDSIDFNGNKSFLYWRDTVGSRIYFITAQVNRKQSLITNVIYNEKGKHSWELAFSSFTHGIAKEIKFKDIDNNYFYLKYEKIVFPDK